MNTLNTMDVTRLAPPQNSRLVVVGGCGGIGRSLVKSALMNNLQVAVFDLLTSIEQFPPPADVHVYALDATKESEVKNAFSHLSKKWYGVDCLVNLAGFLTTFDSIENFQEAEWTSILEGSLKSTFLTCKEAIPMMKNGGSIVNMSSGLALIGRAGYGPYAAAKAGIISLTKTIAVENAPHIRANAVAPSAVNTAFLSGGTAHGGTEEGEAKRVNIDDFKRQIPLGRIAEPEDIVAPILFLLGNAARYITGQVLHINGGSLMV